MEPRVSKREKKLHLSYELPHRIYCSRLYPLRAPNGSTVILYGHDEGIRVLWRGGRRPKGTSARADEHTNNSGRDSNVIVMDEDHEEQQTDQGEDAGDEFEPDEAEQDPDCPFPSIIEDVDVNLNSAVLTLSVPAFPSLASLDIPTLAKTHMIVVVACSNANVLLLTIPLAPPKSADKEHFIEEDIDALQLDGDSTIPNDLAVKVMSRDVEQSSLTRNRTRAIQDRADGRILLAAVGTGLNLWSVKLNEDSISRSGEEQLPIMHSASSGSVVSFNPSPKSGQLLIAGRSGIVRIYDTFAVRTSAQQITSSHDSASALHDRPGDVGRWIMSYQSPFHARMDSSALSGRKKILAADWVLGNRGILVLLEDGEWGVWDLIGSTQAGKSPEDFALRGYLDPSSAVEHSESGKQKKTGSKLAPMTPNTRKAKAENLFAGTPRVPGVAATGGISVTSNNDRSGKVDESLSLWYNGNVYSIPSMQAFCQRTTNTSGGSGSLYAPGLAHISDINLMNENITSISQFASKPATTNLGQMNVQRDLLISAEHRFVILQNLRPLVPSKNLFQRELAERPAALDQRMLDAGELDVNGVDRMLESMAGGGRTRRVGFVNRADNDVQLA